MGSAPRGTDRTGEPRAPESRPAARFAWEKIVKRVRTDPTTKHVALTLATFANPNGSRTFPGNRRLAAVTGRSERTIERSLAMLRQLGLVVRVSAPDTGKRGAASLTSISSPSPWTSQRTTTCYRTTSWPRNPRITRHP